MSFDFDTVIDRRHGDSMKWGRYAGRDILPMWVADMDFAAPEAIQHALQQRLSHPIFGYANESAALIDATQTYLAERYGWQIEAEWIVWLPGLVTGLNVATRAIDGDVFTATPIYPPFLSAPGNEGRQLYTSALVSTDEGWRWNFAEVAEQLAQSGAKLWLLCHPHNPVGRAWTHAELQEIARLAERHDLIVCSDEIHCDLLLRDSTGADTSYQHHPFASLSEAAAARSITFMAPSKTYNIPGLGAAFAVIPDAALRSKFQRAMNGIVPHINLLGLTATEAAFSTCQDWHAALIDYLSSNAELTHTVINQLPGLRMHRVEATYLAWIDASELCRERDITNPHAFFEAAGVGLSAGQDFALNGQTQTFVRLNFGCPKTTLQLGLDRIAAALK